MWIKNIYKWLRKRIADSDIIKKKQRTLTDDEDLVVKIKSRNVSLERMEN